MKEFKKYDENIKTSVDDEKLIIEIPIAILVSAFNYAPINGDGTRVKEVKAKEFAEFVAEHLHDETDGETNSNFITDMLDNLFEFMGEGFIDVSDVVDFPDYD